MSRGLTQLQIPSWSKCQFRQKEVCFLGYVVSSQVVLTFRCSSNFYRRSIQGFSKIATPLILMLRTSSSTDSLTSAAQIVVKYNGVDSGGGGGKSVKKSSKVKKTSKAWKICEGQRFGGKFTEAPILRRFMDTKSSLDITFGSIVVTTKLMELLKPERHLFWVQPSASNSYPQNKEDVQAQKIKAEMLSKDGWEDVESSKPVLCSWGHQNWAD